MSVQIKRVLFISLILNVTGCAHFGLDSEADIAAENCYAYRYGDKLRRINFMQAFDWCHRSANWGNANGQALLGELYFQGLGGKKDIALAANWFEKSARQGHAHAQYMLYLIYAKSINAEQSEKSEYWLKQAMQSGYKYALQTKEEN